MKNKVLEIKEFLDINKTRKKKIVLCHGVFDLLHIGHIYYFEESKSLGDLLIVSITSDRFVNKGNYRPLLNQNARAKMISSLSIVDYVIINDEENAVNLIKKVKPNIYSKGSDYKNNSEDITKNILKEKNAVKSIKGKIHYTSGETHSSSSLINNRFSILNAEQKKFIKNIKLKSSVSNILNHIEQLRNLNVLVIGETIIDEYIFCNSIGKSGKEPVLVNRKVSSEKYAGGALAVANDLADYCNSVKLLSYLGDRNSEFNFVKKSLQKNVKFDYVKKNNSSTILKTRHVDIYTQNKIGAMYDLNDNNLNTSEEKTFLQKLKNISSYHVVIVVDYGHGLITNKIQKFIEKKSKFLAVNAQLNSFNVNYHSIHKYNRADYISIHENELRSSFKNRDEDITYLGMQLLNKLRCNSINITRGKKGSILLSNKVKIHCPAFAEKVIDRVGAGDVLLGITSLCMYKKLPYDIISFLGNIASAISIAKIGTGKKVRKIELIKFLTALLK